MHLQYPLPGCFVPRNSIKRQKWVWLFFLMKIVTIFNSLTTSISKIAFILEKEIQFLFEWNFCIFLTIWPTSLITAVHISRLQKTTGMIPRLRRNPQKQFKRNIHQRASRGGGTRQFMHRQSKRIQAFSIWRFKKNSINYILSWDSLIQGTQIMC